MHKMFINTGIRKTRNTYDSFLVLFTFLSLRFFDMRREREREREFLSMLTFPSDPTTCGTPPQTTGLASASSENQLASSKPKSQLTVFSNSIASGHDVIHVPGLDSSLVFFIETSVIVISAPCVREHLHSMCAPN